MTLRMLAAAAFAVLLSGAAAHAADAPAVLGSDLAGERCELARAPSLVQRAAIRCKGVEAGNVRMGSPLAASADRLAALMAAAAALRAQEDEPARCEAPHWLDEKAGLALSVCTLTGNGWPHLLLAASTPTALYEADGVPSLLPVLVRALIAASGQGSEAAATEAAQTQVAGRIPPALLHAGAGAAASYKNYVELGRLAGGAQDYAGAEQAYRKALAVETGLFGPDSVPVGQTLAELALQVSNQGRFGEADALFQRATPILQGSSDTGLRARLASYLALHAANQRNFADALKLARQATQERRTAVKEGGGADADPVAEGELSHSLRLEAEMALRLGDLAAARAAGEEALWIVLQQPGLPLWWRPDLLALMGEINAASGRVLAAEHNFSDAAAMNAKLFGDSARTAAAHMQLGRFYAREQLYPAALKAYREAFRILDKDRVARTHVVADQILPYFDAAAAQSGRNAGFDAEIFKAAQLVGGGVGDQTIARMAQRTAARTPALAEQIGALQAAERARDTARLELAAENSKADADRDPARVKRLGAALDAAARRYDDLAAKLAGEHPAYARLAAPGPAALGDVEAALAPGAAFLQFVVGAKGGYGLLVTRDGLTLRPLKTDSADLAADVAGLRKALNPALGRLAAFDLKASYALYGKLLGPFAGEMAQTRTLIVAPSPELASLPLSLLVTEPAAGDGDSAAAWLVRRMALSEVPSARALLSLDRAEATRQAAPQPILALAAPGFEGSKQQASALASLAATCLPDGPVSPALLRALPPLPDTAGEARKVAQALGGGPDAVLTGPEASEAALHGRDLSRYRVLYFATHGLLPGELHCQAEPGLALAPPAHARSAADDGLLTADEVAGLKLDADLVVLSACNTAEGGGGRFGGGALEGLADGFFEAGARAVLATHWQVPSAETARLMTDMFADYAGDRGAGYAEALRQAQLRLIADPKTAHPFNWAAFTLIGDGAPAPALKQASAQP